jgi:hypothetical protein
VAREREACVGVHFQLVRSRAAGRGARPLLLPGEAADVYLGEDAELDQAFQLCAGAFDVLRQQCVAEGFADVLGPQRSGRPVEDGEDARVVRVFWQVRRGGGEPVGETGDGLAGDREVLQVRLGLPQPGLQVVDLCAEVVGQGPGGVFLEVQGVKQGPGFTLPPPAARARWMRSRR